ncbi:MAG: pyridoxamine 5'-phosphate oxidase [Gemmataceae bacterium]|nr:pyridoxamine 5'-phosphate oxidase [Gemmataceae bacterium]MCS7269936.1 pyridoxamine 5'-phosphate oxidase [Gemmataceae bacterium]MDW8244219.1 pyridoxamine 5'-phosphate oxidase [Thermogemmata sp.]
MNWHPANVTGGIGRSLADWRQEYTQGGLSEEQAGDDPWALFQRWLDEAAAAGLPEPNAMILATATPEGKPSARMVLLKQFDGRGLTFFTSYQSRKARELAVNPYAAVVFPWHALERQVRIEGMVEKTSAEESDEYFRTRPLGSRLGAWASEQSAVIPNRQYLERQHEQWLARYPDGNVPRPPHWGGYRLIPLVFEFWQGRPNRLHDRIQFSRSTPQSAWQRCRLAP